jgi:hypothetical protein
MQSGELPILEESAKPTGGYEEAIARNGPLKEVILSNAEYIKNVRAGHIPVQLPIVEDFSSNWPQVGDPIEEVGWSVGAWEQWMNPDV